MLGLWSPHGVQTSWRISGRKVRWGQRVRKSALLVRVRVRSISIGMVTGLGGVGGVTIPFPVLGPGPGGDTGAALPPDGGILSDGIPLPAGAPRPTGAGLPLPPKLIFAPFPLFCSIQNKTPIKYRNC
eukprot:Hpha_TRINITY_DN16208_c1_g2::TRINITY_DN16208_c1_g2_i1::g.15379::m.15379